MNKLFKNIKENYKLVIGVLIAGMVLGWLFFHSSGDSSMTTHEIAEHEGHGHSVEEPTVWTCSMHPQIKQDKPGLCPICAMDLVPLTTMQTGADEVDVNEIVMSESAAKLAAIQTSVVKRGTPRKTLYLQGKVQADERNMAQLTARFGGRIEKLFINFTGQHVRKGQKLAMIYSPDLVAAQQELLEALAIRDSRPSLYAAAKGKLKLWDLTDEQILAVEEQSTPQVYFDVLSPIAGTVTMRQVAVGDYVKEGMPLFQVVDLTSVWVLFDAYESDLPWIRTGDKIDFTIQALPGENFSAKVGYVDPFINSKTRVAKVRVEVKNPTMTLKPEMFATGLLESRKAGAANVLLIPKSSLLWTGKRSVVYVKIPDRETPSFLYREVVLGPEAGAFFVVADGLEEGEEIATHGVFKIDAAAQLMGLPSMMNPMGGAAVTGHQHGDRSGLEEHQSRVHASVKVAGNCDMCKERIETAARSVDGVISANWEAERQMLHMDFNPQMTNEDAIQKAIARVGHDTEKYKADEAVYEALPECCRFERLDSKVSSEVKTNHAMITVAGNCDMCKERIETAARSVDGVISAEWNAETRKLHVSYDPQMTDVDAIQKAIANAGHDTEKYKAQDEVYNELPGCCLYERLKYQ